MQALDLLVDHYSIDIRLELKKNDHKKDTDLNDINEYYIFSVMGGSEKRGCYGQVCEYIKQDIYDFDYIPELCEYWEKYHLNDLQAGCVEQDRCIDTYKKNNPEWRYDYEQACNLLKMNDLYKCRGYTYGSNWLVNIIPQEDIEKISILIQKMQEKY